MSSKLLFGAVSTTNCALTSTKDYEICCDCYSAHVVRLETSGNRSVQTKNKLSHSYAKLQELSLLLIQAGEWSLKKLASYSNPKHVKNGMCKLKAVNRDLTRFYVFTTTQKLRPMTSSVKFQFPSVFFWQMVVRIWQKTSSNRYMPGFLNVKQDFCKMISSLNKTGQTNILKSVLENIEPDFGEKYKSVLHACPYSMSIPKYPPGNRSHSMCFPGRH
jgi:hypothetical protein